VLTCTGICAAPAGKRSLFLDMSCIWSALRSLAQPQLHAALWVSQQTQWIPLVTHTCRVATFSRLHNSGTEVRSDRQAGQCGIPNRRHDSNPRRSLRDCGSPSPLEVPENGGRKCGCWQLNEAVYLRCSPRRIRELEALCIGKRRNVEA
jgi:hypothetical protein